jgi:hypothetical protein
LLTLGPVLALARAAPAHAHGKEVEVGVACRAPSPAVPLERRCEATVVFTTDGDPVTDARLVLRAVRPGKAESGIDRVELTSDDRPGQYAATFTLPAYGIWETTVDVLFPSEGQVQLDQEVLPPSNPVGPEGEARIRLVAGFEARDTANILALVFHLLGSVGILAANGAVLLGGLTDERGTRYRRTVVRLLPRLVAGSIAVLAATGAYSARYNAPARTPGLFRPNAVSSLPFGDIYLAVFAAKIVLGVALMVGTFVLTRRLQHDTSWLAVTVSGAGGATAPVTTVRTPNARRLDGCTRLAAANLIAGGAVLVVVVVVDYLHLLTHAGAFISL